MKASKKMQSANDKTRFKSQPKGAFWRERILAAVESHPRRSAAAVCLSAFVEMQSLAANVVSSCGKCVCLRLQFIFAAGLLSVLNEAEDSIKIMSLNSLVQYVDKFWPEIADHIPQL